MLLENIHKTTDNAADPEVNIHGGGGVMLLSQVERNIKAKAADIAESLERAKDADDWRRIKSKMTHDWMHAAVDTIIAAREQLEGKDEAQ